MSVYAIAQLRFTDRTAYDRYQARFMEVFSRFAGRLLAADEEPQVIEGAWNREKLVLMSFPDEAASAIGRSHPSMRISPAIEKPAPTPSSFSCRVSTPAKLR